ncbi:MAG: hypothetical protein ACOC7N_00170 [Chloroflexota bacterium]
MPQSSCAVHPNRTQLSRRAVMAAVILLAAGLRLTRLGLVEFKYDEATTARSALAIAQEGQLPAVGMISSEGPRNPALMSYVLAPAFALSRDPRVAAGWVALLGVAAVGLTHWLGDAFFGWPVGAVAAALFAASPWAVFESRKLWTQNLPVFTLVFILFVLRLVVRRRPWALAPALAAAGVLIGLHLGGLAFLFVLAAILALFRRRLRPLPLLVGVVLLVSVLSPYLIHDAAQGWRNIRGLAGLGTSGRPLTPQAPAMAARVASGYHLEDLAGTRHEEFLTLLPDLRWLDQLEIGLFWLGLAWTVWRVGREAVTARGPLSPGGQARAVLLCWFLVPVGLLARRSSVQPHDFNLLYPVQHLTIALLLVDVARWDGPSMEGGPRIASRVPGVLVALFLVVLLGWQVTFQESFLTFVDRHDTPGGYGAPVKDTLTAARRVEALAADEEAAIVALLPGDEARIQGSAAVFDVLLTEDDRRLVDGREALVLPARNTAYLVHPDAAPAGMWLDTLAAESHPRLAVRDGRDAFYRFFRRGPAPLIPEIPCDNPPYWIVASTPDSNAYVSLLGYQWSGDPTPGGSIDWTLVWRVDGDPPDDVDLHWFNHLVDGEGRRWGQKDGVGLPVWRWRDGDTVLTWFTIPIAPDAPSPPYQVRTGLYIYLDVVNVPVISARGAPPAQFTELGPIDAAP